MKCLSKPKHKIIIIVNYINIIIIFNYNDLLIRMFLFYFQSKYMYILYVVFK